MSNPNYPTTGPARCHDIAEWQRAVVQIFLDGKVVQQSPVLVAQGLPWNFNVLLPQTSRMLRLVVLSVGMVSEPPGLQPAGLGSGPPAQSQNAFDFVDVIGGFAFKTLDDEAVLVT